MNKYHKSILNTLGYDIEEIKEEKVTGIRRISDNRLLSMKYNVFTMDDTKIHLRDRILVGIGLSLDDEEEKKAIRENSVICGESDIIDIGVKEMGKYYFHCFCRHSTGSYNIVLEDHDRRGFYGPMTYGRVTRKFAAYTPRPHGELFNMPPLTITMNKIAGQDDGLYIIINGNRGENICIYPMATEFMLSSNKTNSTCNIPYENFDEAVNSSFIEQISDSPIFDKLMWAFQEIMPTMKLFIADNNEIFKALQERQKQLAIVQKDLLVFDEKCAAYRKASKMKKEEARQELESQITITQLELLKLDRAIAKLNEAKESQGTDKKEKTKIIA